MSNHTPSHPEADITSAETHYAGWASFTKLATWSIISIVVLLALMAATLV